MIIYQTAEMCPIRHTFNVNNGLVLTKECSFFLNVKFILKFGNRLISVSGIVTTSPGPRGKNGEMSRYIAGRIQCRKV